MVAQQAEDPGGCGITEVGEKGASGSTPAQTHTVMPPSLQKEDGPWEQTCCCLARNQMRPLTAQQQEISSSAFFSRHALSPAGPLPVLGRRATCRAGYKQEDA